MNSSQLTSLAIAGGVLYAAFKFGNTYVKGGAVSVAAVIAAKQIPYIREYL